MRVLSGRHFTHHKHNSASVITEFFTNKKTLTNGSNDIRLKVDERH